MFTGRTLSVIFGIFVLVCLSFALGRYSSQSSSVWFLAYEANQLNSISSHTLLSADPILAININEDIIDMLKIRQDIGFPGSEESKYSLFYVLLRQSILFEEVGRDEHKDLFEEAIQLHNRSLETELTPAEIRSGFLIYRAKQAGDDLHSRSQG